MNPLVKQRAVCKTSITKISTWVPKPHEKEDKYAYKFRLDCLETHYKRYCEVQNSIEISTDDLEKEFADREGVEEKYLAVRCKLQHEYDKLDQPPVPQNNSVNKNENCSTNVRLPNIEIPVFSGDCMQYGTFMDLFSALIIDNSRLTSNTEKFYYLKSYLRGEPLSLISQLTVNENNFSVALRLLNERYNNTRQIVSAHFTKLLNFNITKCTAQNLRHFSSDAKSVVNSLLNLDISKADLFDSLLVHVLKGKLDFHTKKALEENENSQNLISSDKFFEFLDRRCNVLENLLAPDAKIEDSPHKHRTSQNLHNRVSLLSSQNETIENPLTVRTDSSNRQRLSNAVEMQNTLSTPTGCIFCADSGHKIYSCPKFGALSVKNRHQFVKNNRMCFGCLGSRHLLSSCMSTGSCSICKRRHHVLLHLPADSPMQNVALNSIGRNTPTNTPASGMVFQPHNEKFNDTPVTSRTTTFLPRMDQPPPPIRQVTCLNLNGGHVLLATANVLLYPVSGSPLYARALLDPGSQNSFICAELARKLCTKIYNQPLSISGICDNTQQINKMTEITFHSNVHKEKHFRTTCAIVDNITHFLPQVIIDAHSLQIPLHLASSLADPNFGTPSQIDLLLGAEIYYSLLKPGLFCLGKNLPSLIATDLGWVISGIVPPSCIKVAKPVAVSCSLHVSSAEFPQEIYVDTLLEKFWDQEEISNEQQMTEDELKAEEIFTNSLKKLADGHFQVDLPLIHNQAHKLLGDSFVSAKHRFISLEKRLDKNPVMKSEYKDILLEYIRLGHASVVPLSLQTPLLDNKYFVPHLCVIKESSASTKVRIVFDYSSKSSSRLSLNDISLKGPRVQPELLDILLRFRNFTYALTADIKKMYRQVQLSPDFHCLQNALWRDSPDEPFQCIQMNTVSFGQTSAPYLACRVLKEIALRNPHHPNVQEALLRQTYVDDILTGANSESDLEQLYFDLIEVLSESGFDLHKFCSNSCALSSTHFVDAPVNKDLNLEENPSKVLGVFWNPRDDTLKINTPSSFSFPLDGCTTKRKVLSLVSQCYDPLGLINPVIVQGKVLMQRIWLKKLSWDEPITDPSLLKLGQTFLNNISSLKNLHIPRCTLLNKSVERLELHGFCDASSLAYGGCVYLRAIYSNGSVSSQLIIAKSRIAPLKKPLTIPKLELCAMTLLAHLFSRTMSILNPQLQITSCVLWSDSQIALSWIKSTPSRWAVFVCNRVAQIQELTHLATWRHIKSHLNPADILSRGHALEAPSEFWFHGPFFLHQSSSDTSIYDTFSSLTNPPEECKRSLAVAAIPLPANEYIALISRSSTLDKPIRVIAQMIRMYQKHSFSWCERLSRSELDHALNFLILQVQKHDFGRIFLALQRQQPLADKRLASLNLFIDTEGLIRVGGRLSYSELPFDQKFPILLPAGNHFTSLVLQKEHRRLGHGGPQNVLSNIRLRYWPLDGLREVKRIISKCLMCHRFKAITAQQIMADLPKRRVTPSRPFQTVGIDYGGPFMIRSSTLRKAPISKCYLALFVCFTTKAVHLELVSDLSSEAFIAALKRFSSRRGLPSVIYSDNATNFTGANNSLKDLYQFLVKNFPTIYNHLIESSIEWKFIPPRSPHWGGLWESAIKSVKSHLSKLLANFTFTFEQFNTVLTQVEAILNSRPLLPLSADPLDLNPLTPGHFLTGAPLVTLPDKDISTTPVNRLKFWQQCTYIQQVFWKRWSIDYLNQLQNRPKWTTTCKDIKINDMVLIKEDDTPPLKWPLARVTDVIPGKDGKVRSIQVLTSSGTYVRPIVKIIPLPMTDPPAAQA